MGSMFIKICGITSPSAVAAAIECGVDAIGFVFAPSPRQLTPAQAAELSTQVPAGLLRIAVTRHPSQRLIDEILEQVQPDILQTDLPDLINLKIPAELQVLPVVRGPLSGKVMRRVLFEGALSGKGELSDWNVAAEMASRTEVILAGGLNAGNVAAAIARVRPFGVDVSSGVESAPGVKDARRMAEFVTAVRSVGQSEGF
jgi:phosphoribosylanthranilate isomerase